MAINAKSNETPNEERDNSEVSASEVPINHMMNAIDTDSEFEDNSDDSSDRNYELLTTQDIADSGQQTTYYPHNYVVDWVDWDEYEASHQQSNDGTDTAVNQMSGGSNAQQESQAIDSTNCESNESAIERQISLSEDRINEIKTLMSGFELPNDNIPVWAQDLSEEQWKAFLSRKLDDNSN